MEFYIENGAAIIARDNSTHLEQWCDDAMTKVEDEYGFFILGISRSMVYTLIYEYITTHWVCPAKFIINTGILEQEDKHKTIALFHLARLEILEEK